MSLEMRHAGLTSRGGRGRNEDSWGRAGAGPSACWAVADGLGGHRGGDVASKLAVEAALASFAADPRACGDAVAAHLRAAQSAVLAEQERRPEFSGMRTTLVLLVSDGGSAFWGHAGDSRLYVFRRGSRAFQTRDHSVPQTLVNKGDIPLSAVRGHEDRNRVLRSIGNAGEARFELAAGPWRLEAGDLFLLCTDGLWEHVLEVEMEVEWAKADGAEDWLRRMERKVLLRAGGEFDNYTAAAAGPAEEVAPPGGGAADGRILA